MNPHNKQIATEPIIQQAYAWLCKQRENTSAQNDVWHLRHHWQAEKARIIQALQNNTYHLSPLKRYRIDGQTIDVWSAADAIALVIQPTIAPHISLQCTHLKNHGGLKKTDNKTQAVLHNYKFAYKSDIKSYYASIDHNVLMQQLTQQISDPIILRLLREYMERVIDDDGVYIHIKKGIPLGSPLSPLMSALYLKPMDDLFAKNKATQKNKNKCYYRRYMDDWIVLAKTRHQLKKMIKKILKCLSQLKLISATKKTFIGRITKGFDFLGYIIETKTLKVSQKTIEKHRQKVHRLYEQNASQKRIGEYMLRWTRWVTAGIMIPVIVKQPKYVTMKGKPHHDEKIRTHGIGQS